MTVRTPSAPTRPPAGLRLGGWLAIPDPLVVEAAGHTAFDWVGIDLQHGGWDLGTAFTGIQILDLMGKPVLVRIAEEDLPLIPRVLDKGAAGVILAMASTPALVAAAIERARYQPEGRRSYGGQRFGMRAEPDDIATLRPQLFAMIEDRRGLEAIEAICAVPGLAGLHVGPVDLGLGLGLGMRREGRLFDDALDRIVAAGHAAGLPVTMHAVRAEQAAAMAARGFDEVVLTADIELLRRAMAGIVAGARQAVAARAT